MAEIGLFEAMHSARALRRLKPDPIPEEVLAKVLDAAIRAPSAGNRQNWAFVVVRDPEQRRRLGAIYRKAADIVGAIYAARGRPSHMSEDEYRRLMSSGSHLWNHLAEAPVLLVACLRREVLPPAAALPPAVQARLEDEREYVMRRAGASIYPAVQNIILACRALGLGTLITTNHMLYEDEVKALLELPDDVQTYALMPIGYPQGRFGPVTRRPLSEVVHLDRWSVPWPG
ncbi:MAG TPA: nitroreductase family protein [Candidatus Binataceae bacterium]|nr:nitroreductase family protein [Candidatus Binataceae bacterium]